MSSRRLTRSLAAAREIASFPRSDPVTEPSDLMWRRAVRLANSARSDQALTDRERIYSFLPSDPPGMPRTVFSLLPFEVRVKILSYLSTQDLHNASVVCPVIRDVSPALVYQTDWPHVETCGDKQRDDLEARHRGRVVDIFRDRARMQHVLEVALVCRKTARAGLGTRLAVELAQSRVENVLDKLALNAPHLRRLTATMPLGAQGISLLSRDLTQLVELAVPASDHLCGLSHLEGLQRLTVFDVRTNGDEHHDRTARLPALPNLTSLTLTLVGARQIPSTGRVLVNFAHFPRLVELRMIASKGVPTLGVFMGSCPTLQSLIIDGPFIDDRSFRHLLRCARGPNFKSLSCRNVKFDGPPILTTIQTNTTLNLFRNLEVLELINCDPRVLAGCEFQLKKALLWAPADRLMSAGSLARLLRNSEKTLQVLSVKNVRPSDESTPTKPTHTRALVNLLLRCLELKHVEVLGGTEIPDDDWRVLCKRVSRDLVQLHVESRPGVGCRPEQMLESHAGHLFTCPDSASSLDLSEDPVLTRPETRFLNMADPEADFQLSRGLVTTNLMPCSGINEIRVSGELVGQPRLKRKRSRSPNDDTGPRTRHYEDVSSDSAGDSGSDAGTIYP